MALHPLNQFLAYSVQFFINYGFVCTEGPEIETEWNNFDFLRIPPDHPSRDMQDTFWIDSGHVLRTHMTVLQGRIMANQKPPVKYIMPGMVYRNENTDSTHEANFYQLDGFAIDKNINMANLIFIIKKYIRHIFGAGAEIRIRPHHFSFVEPGMEVDIKLRSQNNSLNNNQWLEILGAGMIHPQVISNMKLNPDIWQGFAFGLGIDRLMMVYHQINNIKLNYNNDLRQIIQFQ